MSNRSEAEKRVIDHLFAEGPARHLNDPEERRLRTLGSYMFGINPWGFPGGAGFRSIT